MPRPGAVRRVTSSDVAKEVGLSRTTVGYVLNDVPHQKIPEATRKRVIEAAARLGYTPSAAARSLRSGRSDVVLCLLPDIPIGYTINALLASLAGALESNGLTLVVHPRARSTRPISDVWKAITPAAVLTLEEISAREAAAMRAAGIELTSVIWGGGAEQRRAVLTISDERIGRVQAQHLAARGHRRLGYALPVDPRVEMFSDPRLDGVRLSCADLGLDAPMVERVAVDPDSAVAAIRRWRDAPEPVTGICAYNDEIGIALINAAQREGLTVPGDLAVIGVDDIPLAGATNPGLTTVVLSPELPGIIADNIVAALAGRVSDRQPNSIAVQLIERDSV
ncbi:MAG: LacI family DNA-binding transcriptional regulator [Propionibacteriaceae bacterium]